MNFCYRRAVSENIPSNIPAVRNIKITNPIGTPVSAMDPLVAGTKVGTTRGGGGVYVGSRVGALVTIN